MCSVCGCGPGTHHAHLGHEHAGHEHIGHEHHDLVLIEKDILAKNDVYAEANRERFERLGVFALNLVSSPGSGKTTLLVNTITALKKKLSVAVIEGDQQTSIDADRIRATGVPSVQVNTGRGCHLDAHMVEHAMGDLPLARDSVLFIENVGNLVCPASFDLGEAQKVAILSVTEGDDKPLKYPDMFAAATTVVISKIDLLPYVDFNVERCIGHLGSINPDLDIFQLSATTGEGMEAWIEMLTGATAQAARKALCHA
jgi:hydrogenase nickel incorporation protein HypB